MIIFKVKDKDFQLRLTTKGCVSCEKRLGKNPINVFMEATDNKMPKMNDLMIILHECLLSTNHDITLDKTYDLYDDYCSDGNDLLSLIELLISVFEDSGFIPKDRNSKN